MNSNVFWMAKVDLFCLIGTEHRKPRSGSKRKQKRPYAAFRLNRKKRKAYVFIRGNRVLAELYSQERINMKSTMNELEKKQNESILKLLSEKSVMKQDV